MSRRGHPSIAGEEHTISLYLDFPYNYVSNYVVPEPPKTLPASTYFSAVQKCSFPDLGGGKGVQRGALSCWLVIRVLTITLVSELLRVLTSLPGWALESEFFSIVHRNIRQWQVAKKWMVWHGCDFDWRKDETGWVLHILRCKWYVHETGSLNEGINGWSVRVGGVFRADWSIEWILGKAVQYRLFYFQARFQVQIYPV